MADSQMTTDVAAERPTARKRFGPVAAAFLSAGIGAVVLGILVVLSEASTAVHDALELNERVGTLSGKTVFAVAAWLVAWVVLHFVLRDKDPAPRKVFIWTAVLFLIALLLTFPPIFINFAAEE